MVPVVFGSNPAKANPVSQPKESKQPIIRKNGLITNLVGGGILGAMFAPRNIDVDLNSVIGNKEVRDEFLTQVGEKMGDAKQASFKNLLDDFDNRVKNVDSSIRSLMSKALDVKPDALTGEAKVVGKKLKQGLDGIKIPDNIKAAFNTLDDSAEYTYKTIATNKSVVDITKDVSEKLFDVFNSTIKKTPDAILKSVALYAGAGVVISVLFDLIAASARNSKSQK